MWGLVFFLLENTEEQMLDTEIAPAVLQLALTLVTTQNLSPSVHLALLQVRSCAICHETLILAGGGGKNFFSLVVHLTLLLPTLCPVYHVHIYCSDDDSF
jgi:hypothetical protein